MGIKLKKRGCKWYVFVNYHGRRKAKCVGDSRSVAEQVKRILEAKLALGDMGIFGTEDKMPTFDGYADRWMKDYARVECKTSTADGYEGVLRQYLRPWFGPKRLDEIRRDDIKLMISELISKELSRNTIRNAFMCYSRDVQSGNRVWSAGIESGGSSRTLHPHSKDGRHERYRFNGD